MSGTRKVDKEEIKKYICKFIDSMDFNESSLDEVRISINREPVDRTPAGSIFRELKPGPVSVMEVFCEKHHKMEV